ncbi:YceI family protein [Rapidithrix thailandica]|uniref:YceI family protein n=1 Tax=Rapidithrix thailandica TaxID=413964 RepID=A0AAW9SFB0_9BACT
MEKSTWIIDPAHSEIFFKVKHMMVSTVTGAFDQFTGAVETEQDNFEGANIQFKAETGSINTKNSQRDEHLKSDDFFNAEAYPELTFKSTSFEKNGEDYKLTGDLTIRDITRQVTLDVDFNGVVVDPYNQTKAGFELSGKINRKDFNLSWNAVTEAGSIVVSDQIRLALSVQLIKQ